MKILIAIEDSKYSEAALDAVVAQFQSATKEIKVLHVEEPLAFSNPPQMAKGYAPEMEERAKESRALVDRCIQKLRKANFQAEGLVLMGDVRETILDTASEWKADLIILGSHGHKGMQRLLLGSVAESVIRHAPCSVLVVRPTVAH